MAKVSANIWRFPGVEVKARLFRDYPFKEITAHVVGYIGRINQKEMERLEENDELADYRGNPYQNRAGIYPRKVLHGTAGFEEMETDAGGRPVRTLRRSSPVNGHTLKLALDIELQKFAWERFGERRGAGGAGPATGGVLAFISKPGYDPNLFIDGIDSQSWKDLNDDWKKPLVNRALRGLYPPGSTFKPFMAMAALETKFRDPNYTIPDPGYFSLPGSTHRFRDSKPSGWGSMNMFRSIQVSSDTHYYKLAWDMGIDRLEPQLAKFGFAAPPALIWMARRAVCCPARNGSANALPANATPRPHAYGPRPTWCPSALARATTPIPRCKWRTRWPSWPITAWSTARTWSKSKT